MNIGIDITPMQDQYAKRGIGKVAKYITKELIKNKDIKVTLFGFEENFPSLNGKFKFVPFGKKVVLSKPFNPLYWKTQFLPKIENEKLDFFLSYNFERGLPIGLLKTGVFIHDVIPYVTGKYSQKSLVHNFIKGKFYQYALNQSRQADLVFANSKFTKENIIEKGGFKRKKVTVTYLGIEDRFSKEYEASEIQSALTRYGIKFPYILYYGGLEPNKNVTNLINAWDIFLEKNPDVNIKLVIVGRKRSFKKFLKNNRIDLDKFPNIIERDGLYLAGYVHDELMPMLLKGASLFVHLSTYEGFGLALAEAITMRVPILASNTSVYPEIVKNEELLVDPYNPKEIANHINKQLIDRKRTSLKVDISWEAVSKRVVKAMGKELTDGNSSGKNA